MSHTHSTAPTQPLTVAQGDPEHRALLDRFWAPDVDTEPRDRLKETPAYLIRRAAAHKRMMTAIRNLEDRSAA